MNVVIPSEFEGHEGKQVVIRSLDKLFNDTIKKKIISLKIGTPEKKVTLETDSLRDAFRSFYALEIIDLSGLDIGNVTDMSNMFFLCGSLESLDLSNFHTDKVTDMTQMFARCTSLESLDISNFDTKNVTNMEYMFYDCSNLESLDLSNFATKNVTNMEFMFYGCTNLKNLDINNFNTENVTNMKNMFSNCSQLKSLDVSNFDTKNVTDMSSMFHSCSNLESLDVSNFDTSNVSSMGALFRGLESIENLDVSNFNTSKTKILNAMFADCTNLKNIKGLETFDTGSCEDYMGMFVNCNQLNIFDIDNFEIDITKRPSLLFISTKTPSHEIESTYPNIIPLDESIPTIIISESKVLLEYIDDFNNPLHTALIFSRTPYYAKVVYHGNDGTFNNGNTESEVIVYRADHFIYSTMEEAKQEFTLTGTTVLTNNPSTSLSREGSVFNGWYLDEACTKPFDEAATIDFTTLANGTLHLYAGYSEPLQAVELIAYEGGLGTDASNHGDALPEPQWEEGLESYAISVDGEAWDLEEEGVPFAWEYRNSEGEKVESAAKAGSYALYALPRVDDKEIRLDEHLLSIPEEGMAVGEVKVREVSDESAETLSSEIYKGVYEEEGACQIKEAHAHVKAGTQFYKNGNTMYPVNEDAKVVLLWDELIEEVLGSAERMEALHAKGMEAVKGIDETKEVKREFRYLDLVDQNDGNLWVGTEKETVSVYYPYPEGSEEGDRFAVVYYEGLTRDYTMQMSEEALDEEIAKSKGREIEVRKTEGGLEFEVGSKEFGTFEVMWQKEEKPTEPEEKPNTPNEEEKGESNIEEIKKEENEAVHTGDEVSKGMYYVLLGGSMIVFAAMLRKNRRSEQ
ncbi:BspA family leucine-rich repeat surface protein [Massilicoli timonensis]|uniref:BspA family leucine-rich repeat surface protein n=1 Tax=Massilicoli timonensis TaxID=2015901 RepID=UPI003182BE78